jgi:hypothetical protein
MSSDREARRKILQMVEAGKISASEATRLMRALDDDSESAEDEIEVVQTGAGSGFERTEAPEFDEIKARARRFSLISLWVGVFITVFSAWIIYTIQQSGGANLWFFCMILPLMLGVLLIALGAGERSARWLYVDVDRRNARDGEGPRHITLGFPLPLGFVAWLFRTFSSSFQGMSRSRADGIIQLMNATRDSQEPFIVNVDEGGDGEHVRLFIG